MALKESIDLADTLKSKYLKLEKMNQEIENNRKEIASPVPQNTGKRSKWHYFWPYLVKAAVALVIMNILVLVLGLMLTDTELSWLVLFEFGIPVFLLILGCVKASSKSEADNELIKKSNELENEKRQKLIADNEALIKAREDYLVELAEYDNILAPEHRNYSAVSRIKLILQSGKVSDFSEAVDQLS